ncbi:COG4315 family predicted lipoprotein [Streptacidiphilus sp. PAMC 29251]
MKRVIAATAGVAALAALAAGCSSNSGSGSASSSAPAPAVSAPASAPAPAAGGSAAALKVASSADGQILVDGSGRTLYLFEADTGTTSTCNGSCATAWPPDTTRGAPSATGLTASDVGQSTRTDKSTQVTYAGHPLYYFSHDAKPGDVNGQGVTAFGGSWYVVSPSGSAITSSSAATGTPSTTPSSSGYGGGY